jgi:succinate-acetate transporter protein
MAGRSFNSICLLHLSTQIVAHNCSRTAFTSYGAFWLSFATLFIPNSGIAAAYASDPGMEADALGIYLLAWMIVTFIFL